MNQIRIINGLPFIEVDVTYNGNTSCFKNVLLDTDSSGTMLKFDNLMDMGLQIDDSGMIETIRGVGGTELVVLKTVDTLCLGELSVDNSQIEIGGMNYGFDIDGIIKMDFLLENRIVLDLDEMQIRRKSGGGGQGFAPLRGYYIFPNNDLVFDSLRKTLLNA